MWNGRGKIREINLSPEEAVHFWSLVDCGQTGCWEFQGAKMPTGYGTYKTFQAHRIAFTLHHGSIPAGMLICHKCDNRSCCNPDHLFAGTHEDNMQDMCEKGRHHFTRYPKTVPRGEQNNRSKLTEEKVRLIFRLRADGQTTIEIGRLVGVTDRQVRRVLTRAVWKHVEIRPEFQKAI